jgi:hypothetical protein
MIHKQVNMYCYVLTIVSMIMLWKVLLFHIMGCRIIYVLLRKYEIFIFVFYLYYIRKGFTLKLILILLREDSFSMQATVFCNLEGHHWFLELATHVNPIMV